MAGPEPVPETSAIAAKRTANALTALEYKGLRYFKMGCEASTRQTDGAYPIEVKAQIDIEARISDHRQTLASPEKRHNFMGLWGLNWRPTAIERGNPVPKDCARSMR